LGGLLVFHRGGGGLHVPLEFELEVPVLALEEQGGALGDRAVALLGDSPGARRGTLFRVVVEAGLDLARVERLFHGEVPSARAQREELLLPDVTEQSLHGCHAGKGAEVKPPVADLPPGQE
jgi:hypothetical protein